MKYFNDGHREFHLGYLGYFIFSLSIGIASYRFQGPVVLILLK